MSRPVILVTSGRTYLEAKRHEVQSVYTGCDTDYCDAIVAAGGLPVVLPCISDPSVAAQALELCDGVVLTGGGDVLSFRFGEQPHVRSKYQDPVRDALEFELTALALERGLPLLAICRGIQVLNVALGGSLVQDVPSQVPDAVKHYSEAASTTLLHTVQVTPGSLFESVVGPGQMGVNSWHHQAVGRVADGLVVTGRAPDGVVEAVESCGGRPVLGVQFHPEELAATDRRHARLFEWVVAESLAGAPKMGAG